MQHQLVQYQIDAFTTRAFSGNPAAVCPLDHWLDDRLLQAIAEENNKVQALAEASRLGVPATISTDPRNHFQHTAGCPSSEVLGQWGFGFSGGLGSSGVDI